MADPTKLRLAYEELRKLSKELVMPPQNHDRFKAALKSLGECADEAEKRADDE